MMSFACDYTARDGRSRPQEQAAGGSDRYSRSSMENEKFKMVNGKFSISNFIFFIFHLNTTLVATCLLPQAVCLLIKRSARQRNRMPMPIESYSHRVGP